MKSLLLHICCAPDGTIPWTVLIEEGYDVTGYFYGHNIHPEAEYIRREEAVEKLASSLSRPLAIEPYDPQIWFKRTALLASEPEGGRGVRYVLNFSWKARQKGGRTLLFLVVHHVDYKSPQESGKNQCFGRGRSNPLWAALAPQGLEKEQWFCAVRQGKSRIGPIPSELLRLFLQR